jgi:hypothetical protein
VDQEADRGNAMRFASEKEFQEWQASRQKPTEIAVSNGLPGPRTNTLKQTKAEREYSRVLEMEYPGATILPWGITFRMSNGHKYTPDFIVMHDGWLMVVEVKQRGKNGFRQHSYQRAKLAYDQCKVEFPLFKYRWAEKHNGKWNW